MKYLLILFALLSWISKSAAQPTSGRHDATIWYFGTRAGLDFSSGTPVALTNSSLTQHEGSSVMCDQRTGRLLFYSDGVTVWDSTHKEMPNGTGLKGHWTSAQSVLIVPLPEDTNVYYVFTAGAGLYAADHGPNNNGIRYSIVDMRLNGGRGDVTVKNVTLLHQGTEMLTATRHCNGVDYWVIAHDWTTKGGSGFRSYHLTPRGITDTTISKVGTDFTDGFRTQNMAKLSSTGRLMAVTMISTRQALELYDFDNITGAISNARLIDTGFNYYSPAFSPDNSKLYTSSLADASAPNYLYQFDMTQSDPVVILNSRYEVHKQTGTWQGGQIQLAPDGKIYVSYYNRDSLGVIKNPNLSGAACGYVHGGVGLGGRTTQYGLPNFVDANIYGAHLSIMDVRLRVESLVGPTVDIGQTVPINLIVCNNSSTLLTNVGIDVVLPTGLTYVSGLDNYPHHAIAVLPPGSCDTIAMQAVVASGTRIGARLTTCASLSASSGMCLPVSDSGCLVLINSCTPTVITLRMDTQRVYETGRRFLAPVTLVAGPSATNPLTHLVLSVEFNDSVAAVDVGSDLSELTRGTLLAGWTIVGVINAKGKTTVELQAPPGVELEDTGVVLRLPFRMYMGSGGGISSTLHPGIVVSGIPCLALSTTDGFAQLDSICGLNFRFIQIELNGKYALQDPHPHPAGDYLGLSFDLGLDGPTTIEVVDLSGRTVATVLHDMLRPGHYDLVWDARTLPSGHYILHLRSGDWHTSRAIVVQR